jgi:phosphoribosylanthranilate isomerase
MTRLLVKVCGITRREDAACAVDLGADAVGFVFWPSSPRLVGVKVAADVAADLDGRVLRVGVFVDATPELVSRLVRQVGLDAVQLHGDERVDDFRGVGARLVKAVTLGGPDDVALAAAMPRDVTLLVDAHDRARRGGTGQRADWARAAQLSANRAIWLAGGLTAGNVADAVRRVKPSGIDVSSGVESAPGVKDRSRLEAFIAAARKAEMEAV